MPDCDYVVNFAAQRHVDNSIVDRNEFLRTNILGVKNLLDLIKAKNIYNMPLFVMLSTDETYGDSLKEFYTETQILSPSNPYSASKCAGDMLILSYNRTYKVPYVIFRPTNNFGCWQHPEKLIPKSIQLLMRGEKIQLHDDGSAMRCWLHAEDTAKAIYGVIERNIRNEIFNISGDCWFTIKQIAEKIVRSYINVNNEKNIRCEYISYGYKRAGADIVYKIDDSKLRNLTRWKPTRLFSARDIEGDQVLDEIVKHVISNYRW